MPIDLEFILNNGGSVRITKCQRGSIRESGLIEKPLRFEVELPDGCREVHALSLWISRCRV